jgi:hypothetical protein
LSTENSEEAVAEFEERMAGGRAKLKLVASLMGERETDGEATTKRAAAGQASRSSRAKASGEMEDFVGLPRVRAKSGGD